MPPSPSLPPKASLGLTKQIRGGYFTMGSRFHVREYPPHNVYVAEFEMAQIPVTVSQYAAFLETGAVKEQRWWGEAGWAWLHGELDGWGREDRWKPDGWEEMKDRAYHPVAGVTAYEAEAYCAWLSAQKKKVVRLPSEEEWEYAARGDDRRPFPWGEQFDAGLANTLEHELGTTCEAGKPAGDLSPFGVADMAGNVQEWTASVYEPLLGEVLPSPFLRVARGGSYNDTVFGSRTSFRHVYPPGYFYPFLGFRVAVESR